MTALKPGCQRERDTDPGAKEGDWICYYCGAIWNDREKGADWRSFKCPERKVAT